MPTVLETHIQNRFRVQPNHANNLETLHGGNLMKWLDEVAAMSVSYTHLTLPTIYSV